MMGSSPLPIHRKLFYVSTHCKGQIAEIGFRSRFEKLSTPSFQHWFTFETGKTFTLVSVRKYVLLVLQHSSEVIMAVNIKVVYDNESTDTFSFTLPKARKTFLQRHRATTAILWSVFQFYPSQKAQFFLLLYLTTTCPNGETVI